MQQLATQRSVESYETDIKINSYKSHDKFVKRSIASNRVSVEKLETNPSNSNLEVSAR